MRWLLDVMDCVEFDGVWKSVCGVLMDGWNRWMCKPVKF